MHLIDKDRVSFKYEFYMITMTIKYVFYNFFLNVSKGLNINYQSPKKKDQLIFIYVFADNSMTKVYSSKKFLAKYLLNI